MKKRNELLLSELEMNMNEATELFSAETLDGMQMAGVHGGNWWVELGKWIAKKTAEVSLEELIKDWLNSFGEEGATPPDMSEAPEMSGTDENGDDFIITFEADSMKVHKNGHTTFYGVTGTIH